MVVQQVRSPGGASEAKQDDIIARIDDLLAETAQKLEPGQSVDVGNFPMEYPLPAGQVQVDGLTNAELRAADVDTADSGEREYTHVVDTVTDAGDTIIHTPAPGKRICLRWIYAINPASQNPPLIKISLGAEEKYRVWAVSKRQKVTGPVDGALVVNLSTSGNVAVTALLEEI